MLRINFKRRRESGFPAHLLIDHRCGLYVQDFFRERVCLERKRTERSGKPFMLMLLHPAVPTSDEVVQAIASTLFSTTREIDLKGWYQTGSVIGVIYTEIDQVRKSFRETVRSKLLAQLGRVLKPDQLNRLKISCHFYPEEKKKIRNDFGFDKVLYPDRTGPEKRKTSLLLKRLVDISVSLALLILFLPLFLVIAAGVRLTSEGPVLFRQRRIGRFGVGFTFLKFRSMYLNLDSRIHREYVRKLISGQLNKDSEQDSVYKMTKDPRVTPFGRLLRKTSLDELPQFLNVLKGDMSLVGPRPPIPYELTDYDTWHRMRILGMKPGITGLWQVMGRSSTSFNEMVRLDLKYIREWSIWLDLKILFKTPWVVIACRGAY